MKQLINFLREASCGLEVYSSTIEVFEIIIFREYNNEAHFPLPYTLENDKPVFPTKLEDQIRTFLKNQTLESLDRIYKHNHHFIDYCVDNGWLIREEKITHKYNGDRS